MDTDDSILIPDDRDVRAGAEVLTFGCRLNAYESEVIRSHAAAAGLADTVVINSCAVTAEAARQARQAIRRVRRERPGARIVVTGCAAQVDPASFAAMPEVDAVVGNHEKMLAETWASLARDVGNSAEEAPPLPLVGRGSGVGGGASSHNAHHTHDHQKTAGGAKAAALRAAPPPLPLLHKGGGEAPFRHATVRVNDIMAVRETASHLIDGFAERARAYVQVQNGCDHRCTFCIIPYGRGNSRSVPAGEVVAQIARLVDNGYAEVVLTGVDITSWGGDLPGAPKLGRLVRAILTGVPDLKRLRLSSLDAIEIDPELYDFVAAEPRVAPHLHLSLQAGDDLILKRMKRRHSRAESVALCARLKAARPEIAFGADLIAGFPTETDDMFERSLALVDDCGLAFLHVFPFSPRPGTPAARMPQLARAVVKDRAARLRTKGAQALARHLAARVGARDEALIEREGFGRLADFSPVRLVGEAGVAGALAPVALTGHDGVSLSGEIVPAEAAA